MIISQDNPKLRELRKAKQLKGRRALLEGPHLIREACLAGIELTTILTTPEFMQTNTAPALLKLLPYPPIEVASHLLDDLADSDSPRGIVAVANLDRCTIESLPWSVESICLFLDGIQDPGNLGALVRVAEATGVSSVALAPGTVHPNHPRALRASAGSLLRVPVAVQVDPMALSASIPADLKVDWIGLTPHGGEPLFASDLKEPVVLALGSESAGLSEAARTLVSTHLSIEMAAPVESLNVVVSAGVVLYDLFRRRGARG